MRQGVCVGSSAYIIQVINHSSTIFFTFDFDFFIYLCRIYLSAYLEWKMFEKIRFHKRVIIWHLFDRRIIVMIVQRKVDLIE